MAFHETFGHQPNRFRRNPLATRLIMWLLAATLLVVCGAEIARSALGQDVLWDDAYYYVIVARNIATLGHSTFDGMSATNGYHPLWLGVLVVFYALGGARLSVAAQALGVVCIQQLILACTVAVILLGLFRLRGRSPQFQACGLLALSLLLYPWNADVFLGGMESVLVLPCLATFLYLVWNSRWDAAGLAALVLVMARLDSLVYVVFPVAIFVALRSGGPRRLDARAASRVAAPAAVGTGLLMAFNGAVFGSPIPISGSLKSTFPVPHMQWAQITAPLEAALQRGGIAYFTYIHPVTALVIIPGCILALLKSGHLDRAQRRKAILFPILGLVQVASYVLFQKWGKPVPSWYTAPLVVVACLSVAASLGNLFRPRVLSVLGLAGAICVLPLSIVRDLYRPPQRTSYPSELLAFVKSKPRDAIWAATDCGAVPFWTGARFVDLDGLVNGFNYQAALRDGKLNQFLKKEDVRYLADAIYSRRIALFREPMYSHRENPDVYRGDYKIYDFYIYSYLYGVYSDALHLRREQEVWRRSYPAQSPGGRSIASVVFDLRAGESPVSEKHIDTSARGRAPSSEARRGDAL